MESNISLGRDYVLLALSAQKYRYLIRVEANTSGSIPTLTKFAEHVCRTALYILTSNYWVLDIVYLNQLSGARRTHISYHKK